MSQHTVSASGGSSGAGSSSSSSSGGGGGGSSQGESPAVVGAIEELWLSPDELVAGAVAGFMEHSCMFPFDTIKTRMQSGASPSVGAAVRQLLREERAAHLYRGLGPVLISAVPAHAAYFGVYEAVKRVAGDGSSNAGIALAACAATAAHDGVSTPFDVVKQRMQMDRTRSFSSSAHCIRRLYAQEGLGAFFVSLPTTIAMNVPHYAAYWLTYEAVMSRRRRGAPREADEEDTVGYIAGGFLAGAAASVVSFPLDAVKTHLQLGRRSATGGRVGIVATLRELLAARGLSGVFAGVVPRVMYTAPSGAIMMVTYETVKSLLPKPASAASR